jgi:hypothetical protein
MGSRRFFSPSTSLSCHTEINPAYKNITRYFTAQLEIMVLDRGVVVEITKRRTLRISFGDCIKSTY